MNVVGTSAFTETAASTTLNGSRAVTAGNGLVLLIATRVTSGAAATVVSVSDGLNTYTNFGDQGVAVGAQNQEVWYNTALSSGGTLPFTITFSASCAAVAFVMELSNLSAVRGSSFAAGTSTTPTSPTYPSGIGSAGDIWLYVGIYNLTGQSVSAQTISGTGVISGQVNHAQITSAVPSLYLNMAPTYATIVTPGTTAITETIAASTAWMCGISTLYAAASPTVFTQSFTAGLGFTGQVAESGPSGGKSQFVSGAQTMSPEGLGWVADLTLDPSQAVLAMAGSLSGVLIGGPPPPPSPPPVFGPPGGLERVSAQSLHIQPGNQLQRSSPNTLHKQTQ